MKMKKMTISLLCLMLAALVLAGCTVVSPPTTTSPQEDPCMKGHRYENGICAACGAVQTVTPTDPIPNTTPSQQVTVPSTGTVPTQQDPCRDGHSFSNGVCTACGTADPNFSTEPPISEEEKVSGWYSLTKKTVSGGDVTDTYLYNILHLNNGKATWYETDLTGMKTTEAAYTVEDGVVTLRVGLKQYKFNYNSEKKTLDYSGRINRRPVTMRFAYQKNYRLPQGEGTVSFTDKLFGEDLNENFYNYCPTILMEGADTMHIWYCSNGVSGNVTDYVAYRKGTLQADGKWTFSEKQLVLSPSPDPGDWDYRHVCDPSVVKGQFRYKGEQYNYLMAYLGCLPSDCTCNEVGIAVAKNPEGPWIKVDEVNPIANYYASSFYNPNGQQYWGYGQPSLINIDKGGKVLLFYSKGLMTTITQVELWDLSDLDAPKKLSEAELTNRGIVNAGGGSDVINNADFAYDPVKKRIYCIKEDFGYPTDGGVNWITGSNTLFYVELKDNETNIGDTLFGEFDWNKAGAITSAATGYARNHNMGIVTDAYGWIMDSTRIPIVYTMSDLVTDHPNWGAGGQWPALHTYRLCGYVFDL